MKTTLPPYALLRLPKVLELRGVGKTKHYDDIEAGLFTRGVDRHHAARGQFRHAMDPAGRGRGPPHGGPGFSCPRPERS